MYLLDTNHCSRIIQGDQVIINRLQELDDTFVATCVIVQGELAFMAYKSQQRATNLARVQAFLRTIEVYAIDAETANVYGQFKSAILYHFGPRDRSKRSKTKIETLGISENDLWIAAIAVRYQCTIVSADSDFARMRAIQMFPLESWWVTDTTLAPADKED